MLVSVSKKKRQGLKIGTPPFPYPVWKKEEVEGKEGGETGRKTEKTRRAQEEKPGECDISNE